MAQSVRDVQRSESRWRPDVGRSPRLLQLLRWHCPHLKEHATGALCTDCFRRSVSSEELLDHGEGD